MSDWVPCRIGDSVEAVDTPSLLVDLPALRRNLERMDSFVAGTGIRVRPHAKSHKSSRLARLQMASPSVVGFCAQKVGEAEPLLDSGATRDVLVTNEVVGEQKLARLVALAARHPTTTVGVLVDDLSNVAAIEAACRRSSVPARLDVYIELDVGQKRAGVERPDEVTALGRAIAASSSLTLRGIHAYHGAAQHRRTVGERREAIARAAALARTAKEALLSAGLTCDVVTGGGTGTFPYEMASGIYNEIQPGSYALMDVDYARNEQDAEGGVPRFESALFLLSTVMSLRDGRATLDAGMKSQSTDSGPAQPAPEVVGWTVRGVSDEHSVLDRTEDSSSLAPATPLTLGSRVRLVPGHVDPTVNLHDWMVVVEGGRVVDLWQIEGRGRFF